MAAVMIDKCGGQVEIIAQCIAIKYGAVFTPHKIEQATGGYCNYQQRIYKGLTHVLQYRKNLAKELVQQCFAVSDFV
jgi:hypothetical protein